MQILLLSAVMGFPIYLSLPIVLHRKTGEFVTKLLVAAATGFLFFLLADILQCRHVSLRLRLVSAS